LRLIGKPIFAINGANPIDENDFRREWPTSTSRSFERRKSERVTVRRRARSAVRILLFSHRWLKQAAVSLLLFAGGSQFAVEEFGRGAVGADPKKYEVRIMKLAITWNPG